MFISVIGIGTVNSARQKNSELKLMSQIMNDILDSMENKNIPEFKGTILEARLAVHRIITRYQSCESLHEDDPPSRLQKTLKIACVNMGHVNLVAELFFVIKDFGVAYAKRGFNIDHLYEIVKEFIMGEHDKIFGDIISKFLPALFRHNIKQSVSNWDHKFDYILEEMQEKFIEALLDLDFDEAIADVILQFLFSPHKKYSKPSSFNLELIDETLKELLMDELDLDEAIGNIMIEYLTSPSHQRNPYIEDIIQELLEEID